MPRDSAPATKLTYQTAIVLHALASGHRWGFEIIDVTGLGAGTVYPILRRLEGAGLLSSSWEQTARAHAAQRPPRRYYRLTGAGSAALRDALARYPGVAGVLGVAVPKAV
jgi:DNA-binding PadR family transcriptional regulator